MSLVGPRPHPPSIDAHLGEAIEGYEHRFRVKPGMTGWAQVNIRSEERGGSLDAARQSAKLDLEYVAHWSILWDLKILIRAFTNWFRAPEP
jgi:putative colanic acid biosynthesis UDP-glucose lipid carrier transferase